MVRLGLIVALAVALVALAWAVAFSTYRMIKLGALSQTTLAAPVEWVGEPGAACTLLMVGDSRIAQWPLAPRPGWRIGKLGFPGEAAINIEPAARAAIDAAKPTVVVVQAGANDATAAFFQAGNEQERTLDLAARSVIAMGEEAARVGVSQIVVLTVVPPIDLQLWKRALMGSGPAPMMAEINARIVRDATARGFQTLDADRLFRDGEGRLKSAFRRDDLHWSTDGYAALDAALWAAVKPCPGAR